MKTNERNTKRTKAELIADAQDILQSWVLNEFNENAGRIIDAYVNTDRCFGNYRDVYPIISAILQKGIDRMIYGGSDETVPQQKRAMKLYLNAVK